MTVKDKNKIVTTSNVSLDLDTLDIPGEKKDKGKNSASVVTDEPKWFIRTVKAGRKTYQQVCRHYYDADGKRKMEIGRVTWPERQA